MLSAALLATGTLLVWAVGLTLGAVLLIGLGDRVEVTDADTLAGLWVFFYVGLSLIGLSQYFG